MIIWATNCSSASTAVDRRTMGEMAEVSFYTAMKVASRSFSRGGLPACRRLNVKCYG